MHAASPALHDRVFSASFSEMGRWDPVSFHTIDWGWEGLERKKLSSFLRPRKEKIDQTVTPFSELTPVTIHFDGSIEPRSISADKTYVMDMFSARPGDIIVSKIDLKNGAVAIVPEGWQNVAVTNHFAVYKPDLEQLLPEYFLRLIQAPFFKEYLWRNKVGAEGRKEVKLSFFEDIEIPLPTVATQREIIDLWSQKKREIETALDEVQEHRSSTIAGLLQHSDISVNVGERKPKCFVASLSSVERWSVDFNRYDWTLSNLLVGRTYPSEPLSKYAAVNPSTKLDFDGDDEVSFIPMASVSDEDGIVSEWQTRKFSQVRTGYTRFAENDVLWAKITPCMENGKSAIAHSLIENVGFGSTEFHVVRSKDTSILLSEYIHLILRMSEIRVAATRFFTGSAGQQRVPASFLEDLRIPIPPINVQRKIVDAAAHASEQIERLKQKIVEDGRDTESKLERAILGTLGLEALR